VVIVVVERVGISWTEGHSSDMVDKDENDGGWWEWVSLTGLGVHEAITIINAHELLTISNQASRNHIMDSHAW